MIEEFVRLLLKQVKIADEDAAVALVFATVVYFADFFFFPGGMTSAIAAFLAAVLGFSLSRLLKNRLFFVKFGLRQINQMVAEGELSSAAAQELKDRLVRRWLANVYGVTAELSSETKTIEPAKETSKDSTKE